MWLLMSAGSVQWNVSDYVLAGRRSCRCRDFKKAMMLPTGQANARSTNAATSLSRPFLLLRARQAVARYHAVVKLWPNDYAQLKFRSSKFTFSHNERKMPVLSLRLLLNKVPVAFVKARLQTWD